MNLWAYIFVMLISFVISTATRKKPTPPKAAGFEEFDFPQADEGTPQIVVFGDVWLKGWMVLSYGNYRTSPVYR